MSFAKYLERVKGDFTQAIKVEWLNSDESVNFEFTNSLYDISVDLSVNYQSGCRRTCTVKLNNDNNKFPIDFNGIWIGQKFKLWMGIYLENETPYYFPQGVFYVSNPTEVYNPSTRTITLNGIDKWAYLDGTLGGKLTGTYQTDVGVNLYDAIRGLLSLPSHSSDVNAFIKNQHKISSDNIYTYFDVKAGYYDFEWDDSDFTCQDTGKHNGTDRLSSAVWVAKQSIGISFDYNYSGGSGGDYLSISINSNQIVYEKGNTEVSGSYKTNISAGDKITFQIYRYIYSDSVGNNSISNIVITSYSTRETKDISLPVDPIPPLLSPYFITKTTEVPVSDNEGNVCKVIQSVLECPYTATVERGQTYADVLLEYATILCANVYYDVNGRFVLEPMLDTADDITDTNKEIVWDYTVDEKTFLGLTQTYNFDKVYNDFIVLGNIVNGYQFKGRVQNRNPLSNTCVQKIGLKTREPYEDNQYVSDEQCIELAKYYAKTDTILQKSGDISSIMLFHFDVNKLVTISTPNNSMSKELFLITGFSLSSSGTMSVNVTSVNILKDFSVVEASFDE